MYYSVMTQAYSEKEIPSSPNRSRTYDLPITCSGALPLSNRRLVGATAIKLGSWVKHPAYCLDLNVDEWHMRNEINVMVYDYVAIKRLELLFSHVLVNCGNRKISAFLA